MKVYRSLRFIIPCIALTLVASAFIIFPERYVPCSFKGFALWAECVLPSLFPLMVINLLAVNTGVADRVSKPFSKIARLLRLPPAAAVCLVISVCSGYPAGAKTVCELYERGAISSSDVKRLAPFCSTSGPLFILGSVGAKLFLNKAAGWKILICHLISVFIIALLMSFILGKREKVKIPPPPVYIKDALYNSVYGAVVAVSVAGGFIAFFFVAAQIFYDFNILLPLVKLFSLIFERDVSSALSMGLIEATSGIRLLSLCNSRFSVPLAGFLITFGGVSILLQQTVYFAKAKISPLYFAAVKLLQGLLCFALLLICA